jgi:predicted O-methyltransferase YrrM
MKITMSLCDQLAGDIARGAIADDRPQWLRDMPSASDNTARYYPFFYQLARRHAPLKMLEIGTYRGTSAAHMAYGAQMGGKEGQVFTVDIDENAKRFADDVANAHGLRELTAFCMDSVASKAMLSALGPFDVLFIDTAHNFRQAYSEYVELRPLVRDGGLIFFDDISLGAEMVTLWEYVADPKWRLDSLHYTGFGVAMKRPDAALARLENVIALATARIAELEAGQVKR